MKVFDLGANKKLIYHEDKTTEQVDINVLGVEIEGLNEEVEELLAILKNNKKLLLWAKDNFADCSRLSGLQFELEEKDNLLKEILK